MPDMRHSREYASSSRPDDARLPHLDPDTVRDAQRVILSNAKDAEDAALLMTILGIDPEDWTGEENV